MLKSLQHDENAASHGSFARTTSAINANMLCFSPVFTAGAMHGTASDRQFVTEVMPDDFVWVTMHLMAAMHC